jgi:periplasmic protein TonB
MELKKTPKADLENKRNIFIQMGLVIALGIVFVAFNINDSVRSASSFGDLEATTIEDEVIPVTRAEEIKPPPPPPPPKVVDVLTIVDDNVEIDVELEIDNSEADKATIINALPQIQKKEEVVEDSEIFVVVEDMPEFPGGETALRSFINKNVNYPVIAAENGIQGKVYVRFVVDKDGSVTNAEIARGIDPSLDQEALRVVRTLPKWKPGKQRGKPVRVSYTVPINFQLQ